MRIKKASKDFSVEDLPKTRKEMFKDCLKNRYSNVFKLGLVLLLFSLPLIITMLFKDILISNTYERYNEGLITIEEATSISYSYGLIFNLIMVLGFVVLGIGLSGIYRIVRQMVWMEGIIFLNEFKYGIKKNWFSFSILFIVVGLINVLCFFILKTNISIQFLRVLPIFISLFILMPIGLYLMSEIIVYKNTILGYLKGALILFAKSIPVSLLSILIVSLPIFTYFISFVSIKYLLIVLYILFVYPIFILFFILYSFEQFDKLINIKDYPELVNRGLNISKRE